MENEYNRIVLIGNGFDRALGLKTSYSDFILNYLRKTVIGILRDQSNENDLISFTMPILNTSQPIDNYIQELNHISTVKELLEFLSGKAKIRFKYEFFEDIVTKLENARWVDIEQHYYETLKREFRIYKANLEMDKEPTKIIALNKCMDELTSTLNDFIKEQQIKIYLEDAPSSFIASIREPLKPIIANLVKRHSRKNAPSEVLFLNFNYTDTVKQIINSSFDQGNTKHRFIHGTVNDEDNPIIFGYGDDTGEDYKELEFEGLNELLRKIKSFQYPRTHNYHNLLNYLERGEFDVFVVGHSCGLSDRTMLKTIFEHSKCLVIQNFHYKGESEDFDKRMEISRHFSDKALMRERVLPYNSFAVIPQCQMKK